MASQSIPLTLDHSRQNAVFERVRVGILAGTLAPGVRLPATRNFADELGVARQTVVLAYERLAAEGYVRARMGSGTYVATDLPDAVPSPGRAATGVAQVLSKRGAAIAATPINALAPSMAEVTLLAPGVPANDMFPTAPGRVRRRGCFEPCRRTTWGIPIPRGCRNCGSRLPPIWPPRAG